MKYACQSSSLQRMLCVLSLKLSSALKKNILFDHKRMKENIPASLISWIWDSRPPMSAYVSRGALSTFITLTRGSVSSAKTPTIESTCKEQPKLHFHVQRTSSTKKKYRNIHWWNHACACVCVHHGNMCSLLCSLLTLLCVSTELPGSSKSLSTKLIMLT